MIPVMIKLSLTSHIN